MKFCNQCGASLSLLVPEGDDRKRHVCEACGTIHYVNPRIVAGCLPVFEDRVLLCRRAIHPRKGYWTLPAGFMENGETLEQAASRETLEEACASVELDALYTVFSLPHISQVYVFFRARLPKPDFSAGTESLEVALFSEEEIPWDDLAFPTMTDTLRYYFEDRKTGDYPLRSNTIAPMAPKG